MIAPSSHGLRTVAAANSIPPRIWWGTIFVGTTVLFLYNFETTVEQFLLRKVLIERKINSAPIPFPAVTFCNLNAYKGNGIAKVPELAALAIAYEQISTQILTKQKDQKHLSKKEGANGTNHRARRSNNGGSLVVETGPRIVRSPSECPSGWLEKPGACYFAPKPNKVFDVYNGALNTCKDRDSRAQLPVWRDLNEFGDLLAARDELVGEKTIWAGVRLESNVWTVLTATGECSMVWLNWHPDSVPHNTRKCAKIVGHGSINALHYARCNRNDIRNAYLVCQITLYDYCGATTTLQATTSRTASGAATIGMTSALQATTTSQTTSGSAATGTTTVLQATTTSHRTSRAAATGKANANSVTPTPQTTSTSATTGKASANRVTSTPQTTSTSATTGKSRVTPTSQTTSMSATTGKGSANRITSTPQTTSTSETTGPYGNCSTSLDHCQNGGICWTFDGKLPWCECLRGFSGISCETGTDDCSDSRCHPEATCIDKHLDYECKCSSGYTGQNCDIDINECEIEPCGTNEVCKDFVNGYSCLSKGDVKDIVDAVTDALFKGGTNDTVDDTDSKREEPPTNTESLKATIKDLSAYLSASVDEDILRSISTRQEELIQWCRYGVQACEWIPQFDQSYGNCYTFNGNKSRAINSERAGQDFGLQISLNAWPELYSEVTDTVGFKMVIHKPGETPFPAYKGYNVMPGYGNHFQLTSSLVEHLGQPYRNCMRKEDTVSPYYYEDEYSTTACYLSYLQERTITTCGCANPKISYDKDIYAVCVPANKTCVDALENDSTVRNPACLQECRCSIRLLAQMKETKETKLS